MAMKDKTNAQKGIAAAMKGEMEKAEQHFRKAINDDKDWLGGGYNLLRLLNMNSRDEEAVNLYKQIKKNVPEQTIHPQVTFMAGQSALKISRDDVACSCFAQLNEQHPENIETACMLSKLLIENGQLKKAEEVLIRTSQSQQDDPNIWTQLAIVNTELGEYAKADTIHQKLIASHSETFLANFNYGKFLAMTGKKEQAINYYEKCLRLVPNAPEAIAELNKILHNEEDITEKVYKAIDSGRHRDAVNLLIENKHSIDPIIYYAAVNDIPAEKAYEIPESKDVRNTELIKTIQLFEEKNNTLKKLEVLIRNNDSLTWDRAGKPTRKGSQTHEILKGSEDEAFQELSKVLMIEVLNYIENKQHLKKIAARKQIKKQISGWAVILQRGGHQKRHIHPEAVVSGVLYIKTPEETSSSTKKEGNLVFPSNDYINIVPKSGLAVLFPSYLAHETVQTKSQEERICIAFNLI